MGMESSPIRNQTAEMHAAFFRNIALQRDQTKMGGGFNPPPILIRRTDDLEDGQRACGGAGGVIELLRGYDGT